MPDILLQQFDGGLQVPTVLEVSGAIPWSMNQADGYYFNVDWRDDLGNIFFHFNPRKDEKAIILHSRFDGEWTADGGDVINSYPFNLESEVPFVLRFEVGRKEFRVLLDGREICRFKHRRAPDGITKVRTSGYLWRLERLRGRWIRRHAGRAHPPHIVPANDADSWRAPWSVPQSPSDPVEPLDRIRLFGVLGTWMEEDIVEAAVENAFLQGCEGVYLVDNGSPDATVERARRAGATLARSFETGHYDEAARIEHMQAVIDDVSRRDGGDHIWWLWLDADEFAHGAAGMTVREHLSRIDRRCRVVGARFFNHFPTKKPCNIENRHPLDYQPVCHEIPLPFCELAHHKHPLQRWDRDAPRLVAGSGFHYAVTDGTVLEPLLPIYVHHFAFREPEVTRRRLELLFGTSADCNRAPLVDHEGTTIHMRGRLRSLDAVYAGRWDEVAFFPPCIEGFIPDLRPFDEFVGTADAAIGRWY